MKGHSRGKSKYFLKVTGFSLIAALSGSDVAVSDTSAQQAAATNGRSATVSLTISPKKQAAAASYWTRQRVADAPAMALPMDTGSNAVDEAALNEVLALGQEALGAEGATAAGAAAADADDVARAAFAEDWIGSDESAATDFEQGGDTIADLEAGTAAEYTSYSVNSKTALWTVYPHQWVGKLTFQTPSGGASCSATAISGNNFVTAAHCVYDTTANRWYSNWVFTPAYRNGNAPYGTFSASACTILTSWVNLSGSYSILGWTRHDVAVCTANKNSAGKTLNAAVGYAGRMWNSTYTKLVFNGGYPADNYNLAPIPSPAQYLTSCTAESFLHTTDTLGSGCYYARGMSGGSWLVNYKALETSGYVNSVNSGLYVGQQNLYGARFNSSNIVPLCTARGC